MRCLRSRFAGLYLFGLLFVAASFLLRTALFVRSISLADTRPVTVCLMYLVGLGLDLVACFCCVLPVALLLIAVPDRFLRRRTTQWAGLGLYAVAVLAVLYHVAVEWFFWEEFETRLNFLAVDYLEHTREVFGNIWESYPVVPFTVGILLVAGLFLAATARIVRRSYDSTSSFRRRLKVGVVFLAVPCLAPWVTSSTLVNISKSPQTNALARNGALSFVAAMLEANLPYRQVYQTREERAVFSRLRALLTEPNSRYASDDVFDITRHVANDGPERRHNVVMVIVESLSARFLGAFGNTEALTPNLDALAREGLLFRRMYATGTRTIRGLEAINYSLPPSPGRTVAKRRDAGRLFSAERVFKARGYRAKFIYGGDARFDSMRSFLTHGGFEVIDRTDMPPEEVTFSNVWGVCDEDLYDRVLKECDESHARKQPFLTMALTTTNHMPNTYPQKIDIPSGTGVEGGVKYSDYAIGQLVRKAKRKPWFDETIFVFVADHCARLWAKGELAAVKYHIPAIFYAPKLIAPGANSTLCSQVDIMPALLGILKFSYRSKLFGRDILNAPPRRAFIATPAKLGLLADGKLAVLAPKRRTATYAIRPDGTQAKIETDEQLLFDAVTYYQAADYLLTHKLHYAE